MTKNLPQLSVEDFGTLLKEAKNRFLALDYDGTLAPFHTDPMQAHPLPGVPTILKELVESKHTNVAIISGRPAQEIRLLLGNLGLVVAGSHGFELIYPDGRIEVKPPKASQKDGLKRAKRLAEGKNLGSRLESKVASLALHTRGMEDREAMMIEAEIFKVWSDLAPAHELECRRFKGGVEIRSLGRNKGDVLVELMSAYPEETLCVYIGDDDTDEDAFGVLKGRGVAIKVGDEGEMTKADAFLPDCGAVRDFLWAWLSFLA